MTSHHTFGKRYEFLEEIGRGGMGRVYKVHDTSRDQVVALKELSRQHIDTPAAILGLKNEFRIMSRLRHPNFVEVLEFGMTPEKIPFITMEYVRGTDLSRIANLSHDRVTDIIAGILHAIAFLHSRLYVHRDLKPDNIIDERHVGS
jgi:serine/threonine protein kinase